MNRRGIILPSTMLALLLAGVYAVLIRPLATLPRKAITRHQRNIVRLEEAVNVRRKAPAILVGSSLAGQLEPKWLGTNIISLAVNAGGAETGLSVSRFLEEPPKLMVIELNYFNRGVDEEALDYLAGSPLATLRRQVPALWQYNHPLNLLLTLLQAIKVHRQGGQEVDPPESKPGEAFEFALQMRLKHAETLPEQKLVEEQCQRLKGWIDELRSHGTEVVLTWFPTDERVRSSPSHTRWREAYLAAFPTNNIRWLDFPKRLGDHTIDGEHLTVPAAHEAAEWLVANLK